MKPVYWLLGLLALLALGAAVFVVSGAYNIAADEPHWRLTEYAMDTVRRRSIAARASGIVVPDLDDESMIRTGAGNYDAMCVGCHRKPGAGETELSSGLFPSPPNLSRERIADPAASFWVIKHGIKMTGMPAWGKSMEDEYIWGMVAFMRKLPDMSEDQYNEIVEISGGHQHGEIAPARDAGIDDHAKAPPHEH